MLFILQLSILSEQTDVTTELYLLCFYDDWVRSSECLVVEYPWKTVRAYFVTEN